MMLVAKSSLAAGAQRMLSKGLCSAYAEQEGVLKIFLKHYKPIKALCIN
jgi:hypothetical protein